MSSSKIRLPHILTHRGLEPPYPGFFSESSIQSFSNHLSRGFGLEVDLNFTKDGIVLCHDAHLYRMTEGQDERCLQDLTTEEACAIPLKNGRLGSFAELMKELKKYPHQLVALHFKGTYQNEKNAHTLWQQLSVFNELFNNLIVFDLTLETARFLKKHCPSLPLAASVAHPFDIARYQAAAQGTLLSMEEILAHPELFRFAWLDEWDLADQQKSNLHAHSKKFYTPDTFKRLRSHDIKIALVTPELHATSPGLLGGESHPDAENQQRLFNRIREILTLKPDAICTDYPVQVSELSL